MINIVDDIFDLVEGSEVEVKAAVGKDRLGCVPESFYSTYSAMANTNGGSVIFGIEEKHNKFYAVGIKDVRKVKKQLFDCLNNKSKVNANILQNNSVKVIRKDNLNFILIET